MAFEQLKFTMALTADADLSEKQFHAVKCSGRYACDVAADESEAVGILITNPKAGVAGTIQVMGIARVYVPENVSVEAGKGIAIADGAAAGVGTFGVCLESVEGEGYTSVLLGVNGNAGGLGLANDVITIAQTDATGVDVALKGVKGTVTAVSTNAKVIATVAEDKSKVTITTNAADKGTYTVQVIDTVDSVATSKFLTVVVNA